jgi:hypothetical protein
VGDHQTRRTHPTAHRRPLAATRRPPRLNSYIRRAKMNGDPLTGRIGLTRLNAHQRTGRLACILPPDSPARALRTCAP